MDMPSESLLQPEKNEVPRKGDVFQVMDNEEIKRAGGLALHEVEEEAGVLRAGTRYVENQVVRMPVGTKVTVVQAFKHNNAVWIVFDYLYLNPNQGQKTLRACAMVEQTTGFTRTPYMEKVTETASALEQLRLEIEGPQSH